MLLSLEGGWKREREKATMVDSGFVVCLVNQLRTWWTLGEFVLN